MYGAIASVTPLNNVADGVTVAAGDPMVTWDVAATRAEGLSAVVPVVAMDRPKGSVPAPDARLVAAGDALFDVDP
jgi:PTS system glucose-specific IIA component